VCLEGEYLMNICKVSVFILLSMCGQAIGQTSFWNNSTVPGTKEASDTASVTLGLKVYSDVPGSVTAVRFYKGPGNTGTHIGTLSSSTGQTLATVTFSGETTSGWQEAAFATPVKIAANTTYVVSYLAPRGYYAYDRWYPWTTLQAGPLHVSGSAPGVYQYGSGVSFPTSTWQGCNYWVDLVFVPDSATPPPVNSKYNISGNVQGAAAKLTLSGVSSGSTTTDAAGNYTFTGLSNGYYVVAASQSGYTFTPSSAAVSIQGASVGSINFTSTAVPTSISHSVLLSWNATTSTNISGYNLYRAAIAGSTYVKLNPSPLLSTTYVDKTVESGRTYYYVATAVDRNNLESEQSNQTTAVIPTP
jgi:hypothetical protein